MKKKKFKRVIEGLFERLDFKALECRREFNEKNQGLFIGKLKKYRVTIKQL